MTTDRMILALDTNGNEPNMDALIALFGVDTADVTVDKQAITVDKQAITDDKQAITVDKQAIKPSDKIFALQGISSKTRDNLIKIIDYMKLHPSVKNAEISVLLNLGYDRSRLLLTTLVNESILTSSGKNKDRIYSLV